MTITEEFNKDVRWMLAELKREELASAHSKNEITFFINQQKHQNEPTQQNQRIILHMLSERDAIALLPHYPMGITAHNLGLYIEGNIPVKYLIKILQPEFDIIFKEYSTEELSVNSKINTPISKKVYSIKLIPKGLILNDIFILAKPHFFGENSNFIDYMIKNPNKTLDKVTIDDGIKIKQKKSFHQILDDLGFKGEIRNVFFNVSKEAIEFRNNVPEYTFEKLGVNTEKLTKELSELKRLDGK